uniref:Uncharacterized protein n=1 Tax=Arundo donax TaxID=35708 RepID=A0A0A9GB44_ARUDO
MECSTIPSSRSSVHAHACRTRVIKNLSGMTPSLTMVTARAMMSLYMPLMA